MKPPRPFKFHAVGFKIGGLRKFASDTGDIVGNSCENCALDPETGGGHFGTKQ